MITQEISTISTLADAPNPLTDIDEDVFDSKGYTYTVSQATVNSELQTTIDQLNTFATQANALETNVNDKEASAVSSANTATTKADEASASATSAYNAKLAAEAALDNLDDRYLGAKATPPTLDNDGNTLQSGAMYWNTTNNTMYVRDATLNQWISLSFVPTDHGGLTGLSDDDHTQYHNDARGDNRYLKLVGGTLTGALLYDDVDKGTVSTGTVTFTQSYGNVQKLTVGGNLTIALNGWAANGVFCDLLLNLVNAGSATVTLPTINWIKPDGTKTTTFSEYLTAISRPSLQAIGSDFIYLFSIDGGTTVYGKLI